jgi:NifU-like protein involved in Fe-S cluster formation
MYSPEVLDHFKNPRNAGELPSATVKVEVSNPVCGDVLQLAARVEGETIFEARFKAKGCVTSVACGSYLATRLTGMSVPEARRITPQQISAALGDLPPATMHGAQLAYDGLLELLSKVS